MSLNIYTKIMDLEKALDPKNGYVVYNTISDQVVEELKKTNDKLDTLIHLFQKLSLSTSTSPTYSGDETPLEIKVEPKPNRRSLKDILNTSDNNFIPDVSINGATSNITSTNTVKLDHSDLDSIIDSLSQL